MPDLPSRPSRPPSITEVPQREHSSAYAADDGAADKAIPTFFFSYAGIDRAVAAQFVQGLQSAGVRVWWDQQQIE